MSLKNHQVTEQVEQLTKNFREMLKTLNQRSRQQGRSDVDPSSIIGQLLYNPNPYAPISLQQINTNYRAIMNVSYGALLQETVHSPQDSAQLAKIISIHLEATAAGFQAYAQQEAQKEAERNQEARQQLHAQSNRPVVVKHIHYHQGYYRDPWLDFYRDMWFYQMMFDNHHHHHTPATPTTANNNKEDDVSLAGLLLALALVAGAAATLGYSVMQTYYRIDEMLHGEDLLGNTVKLTATGFAAWSGFLAGAALGAAYFANPVLGAICTSIIASAAGMKASKWGIATIHEASNTESALAHDPRFSLSETQAMQLDNNGYDVDAVREALREIAIMIKQEPSNGLKFWHNPHGPLISLMRDLKSGYPYANLVLNGKTFNLAKPYVQYQQEAVMGQPVPAPLGTDNLASAATSTGKEQPPLINPDYQPVERVEPQAFGGYPQFNGQQAVPPAYQDIYPTAPLGYSH